MSLVGTRRDRDDELGVDAGVNVLAQARDLHRFKQQRAPRFPPTPV
jgi:hypothetical protein